MKVEDFEPLINETVTFSADDSSFTAIIKLVDRLIQQAGQAAQPFSVVFRADHKEAFAQQTYTVQHPVLGNQIIFLVPIGPDETGMCYEAVFA